MFKRKEIAIEIISSKRKTSYAGIINEMRKFLKREKPFKAEAWLVVDVDNNRKEAFNKLQKWHNEKEKHFFAISSPCFEYWLLLHFVENPGQLSIDKCKEKLKAHIPNYDKDIDERKFHPNMQNISEAIARARKIEDQNKDISIFERNGSTVYDLVEKLIGRGNSEYENKFCIAFSKK
jgi:hypothetical protein